MRFDDFERLIRRLSAEVPGEFLEGIAGVEVSRRALPDPVRAEVYTLGECIQVAAEGEGLAGTEQSRLILYYGSFQALAGADEEFDWRAEAWETLTHELRHHLEWRARAPELEAFDRAAEQNFARQAGEPFDPEFYLSAEPVAEGVYRLDDDYFIEQQRPGQSEELRLSWHGADYRAVVPVGLTLPAFLTVEGVSEPPPGELVLVLAPRPRLGALFRRPSIFQARIQVTPAG
jgi:hypothetical protein